MEEQKKEMIALVQLHTSQGRSVTESLKELSTYYAWLKPREEKTTGPNIRGS